MPRSVVIVSSDPRLFDGVQKVLRHDARFTAADGLLHCDGTAAPLTNIYPIETESAAWDAWELPEGPAGPGPQVLSLLVFECRSPAWIAEVGKLLAARLEAPLWFVDAADRTWPADQVDPTQVALS